MRPWRRLLLAIAVLALLADSVPAIVVARTVHGTPAAVGRSGRTQVFLLGSQGGQQRTQLTGAALRGGPSALIVVDGIGYMLDAGVGALLRLNEAGFDANVVRHVFVTHHHQDHNADLGNVIGFSWTAGRFGGSPDRRLDVWGPPGTRDYLRGYRISTARSIADQEGPLQQTPPLGRYVRAHQLSMRGAVRTGVEVMRDERIAVRAVSVNHGTMPAVAYRFETPDLTLVFSGDRGDRGDELARFATGADVLFHEISDLDVVRATLAAQGAPPRFVEHQLHDHSGGELVGRTATEAGVRTLVLYHLVPGTAALTDERWRSLVAPYFAGEIVVGKDLLAF